MTTSSAGRVTALVPNDNGLDGTLPATLGNLTACGESRRGSESTAPIEFRTLNEHGDG